MGGGSWTSSAFTAYSNTMGRNTCIDSATGYTTLSNSYDAQDLFTSNRIQPELNPLNVVRECRDTEEHPNTIPVILALDVTGSMGPAAAEVAKKLNEVMSKLYEQVKDVEFMIMGIGDLAYDEAPIQASQFESDIRIAEQLDKVYFEAGGGGNGYESYTSAWYFGLHHTDLDCWKRGKKGIIITMGDEPLNPYLPKETLSCAVGDSLEANVETSQLYNDTIEKFNVYHLAVNDRHTCYARYKENIKKTFGQYLDDEHFIEVGLDSIASTIVDIVMKEQDNTTAAIVGDNTEGISW